jgi:hypothetical protein
MLYSSEFRLGYTHEVESEHYAAGQGYQLVLLLLRLFAVVLDLDLCLVSFHPYRLMPTFHDSVLWLSQCVGHLG